MMNQYLTIKDASIYLNVKQSWLRMAVFKKTIPYIKVGRLVRFKAEDLDQWLEKNTITK